jgi:hypothetical protein
MGKWYSSLTGAIFLLAVSTRDSNMPKGHPLTQKIITRAVMIAMGGSRPNPFLIRHTVLTAITNLSLYQGNLKTSPL